jgi:hypothetical protein
MLITGASSGIGRELAVQLAARAKTLVLVARCAGRLDELKASLLAQHPQLRVVILPADLSDDGDVERVVTEAHEQARPVDVLVNNADIGDQELYDRADWAHTRQVLHTNVLAVAHLTAALVPSMVQDGRGGVLNIGSGAGLTIMPAAAAYSASKHFIDGVQRSAARGPGRHRSRRHPGVPGPGGQRVRPDRRVNRRDDRRAAAIPADQRRPVRPRGAGRL